MVDHREVIGLASAFESLSTPTSLRSLTSVINRSEVKCSSRFGDTDGSVSVVRKHRSSVQNLKSAACTIYHNPRCSKSRATLSLLQDHGIAPTVIEYLKTPLSTRAIQQLLGKLNMEPQALVRKGEETYRALFADKPPTAAQLIAAMAAHPELIERPIVVIGERAALGRPPENVLQLLK